MKHFFKVSLILLIPTALFSSTPGPDAPDSAWNSHVVAGGGAASNVSQGAINCIMQEGEQDKKDVTIILENYIQRVVDRDRLLQTIIQSKNQEPSRTRKEIRTTATELTDLITTSVVNQDSRITNVIHSSLLTLKRDWAIINLKEYLQVLAHGNRLRQNQMHNTQTSTPLADEQTLINFAENAIERLTEEIERNFVGTTQTPNNSSQQP